MDSFVFDAEIFSFYEVFNWLNKHYMLCYVYVYAILFGVLYVTNWTKELSKMFHTDIDFNNRFGRLQIFLSFFRFFFLTLAHTLGHCMKWHKIGCTTWKWLMTSKSLHMLHWPHNHGLNKMHWILNGIILLTKKKQTTSTVIAYSTILSSSSTFWYF